MIDHHQGPCSMSIISALLLKIHEHQKSQNVKESLRKKTRHFEILRGISCSRNNGQLSTTHLDLVKKNSAIRNSAIRMVVATLIHERYQFITEGFLPEPKVGALVGILCPECQTPLRYHAALEDAWRIHCPRRPRNEHNWRTWQCDQLNHERALIHAGASRPIVSSTADWGPRMSPAGVILPPKPTKESNNPPVKRNAIEAHPFLGRQSEFTPFNQLNSLAGPHRTQRGSHPCLRPSRGPAARTHRTNGNKGCPYQYCQACCLEYGLGPCPKHVRPGPPVPRQAVATKSNQLLPPVEPQPSTSTDLTPAPARPRLPRPHQWAQSANSLGRRLDSSVVSKIQINRAERYEAVQRGIANQYGEAQVVVIYLWLNESEPKVISAHLANWPKASLDESPLLMQACTKALGPGWNRALCFWDEKIDTWSQFLAQTLQTARNHGDISSPIPRQQKGDSCQVGKRGPPNAWFAKIEKQARRTRLLGCHANCSPEAQPPRAAEESPDVIVVNSKFAKSPNITQVKRERELSELPEFDYGTDNGKRNAQRDDHLSPEEDELAASPTPTPMSTDTNSLDTTATSLEKTKKKGWPSSSVLVSRLLAWYKDSHSRPPAVAWKEEFGDEWKYVSSTMYRYKLWIKTVDYQRFKVDYSAKPLANVGEARILYQKEFKEVCKTCPEENNEDVD
ncbi:uncharacterized protein MELLADRAFT_104279 [Melampsora larici-populina 98AG31]|uniref:Uncharacterized protein n=1 Tax=Melampsora larici-populina (strain 98AG31 / pathotype 3-4-7) TaxID=747676 RepID=F4RE70_MELLP|nr:uncharacterized protein MELLADRAFT_104279 [Melampsora larici-populina 98AG31]EGG09041.1 hypothetical protein MELLADRAFT_104279 [Melampsora larici-populina 98AG31]